MDVILSHLGKQNFLFFIWIFFRWNVSCWQNLSIILSLIRIQLVCKARARKSHLSTGSKILNWLVREAPEPCLPWHFTDSHSLHRIIKAVVRHRTSSFDVTPDYVKSWPWPKKLIDPKVWCMGCRCQFCFYFVLCTYTIRPPLTPGRC